MDARTAQIKLDAKNAMMDILFWRVNAEIVDGNAFNATMIPIVRNVPLDMSTLMVNALNAQIIIARHAILI